MRIHGVGEELWSTPIIGGTVEGPGLRGDVVSGGGDWSITRGEATELDARCLLRADDGALNEVPGTFVLVRTTNLPRSASAG
ncbi:MAG TPA: DUF3237 family protein [Solirubrobacteraceae bacterium]|nr:DUF3237 family protein [Solirubrobacteraceae bacterium]